jgi:hypothetical protein
MTNVREYYKHTDKNMDSEEEYIYSPKLHSGPSHFFWESENEKEDCYPPNLRKAVRQVAALWLLSLGSLSLMSSIKRSLSTTEKQFNELAYKWKKETAAYSNTLHITRNDSYLDIIGMGSDVVPLILRDLQKTPDHWFVALKAITKENPVPKEHFGNIKKMREHWLEWGRKKNLI